MYYYRATRRDTFWFWFFIPRRRTNFSYAFLIQEGTGMDQKELKKVLAGFCVAGLLSGSSAVLPPVCIAGSG